jgi:hypothetical protein
MQMLEKCSLREAINKSMDIITFSNQKGKNYNF